MRDMTPDQEAIKLINLNVELINKYIQLGPFASDKDHSDLLHTYIGEVKRTFKGGKVQMLLVAQVLTDKEKEGVT